MFGISSSGKEQISNLVEEMFDNIALQLIGDIPKLKNAKRLVISSKRNFGLADLFVQAMQNKTPNELEADALKSLLSSAFGYIESLKNKTKSNVTERIDSLAKEAVLKNVKLDQADVDFVLADELKKAKSHLIAIAEAESTKLRNIGTMMDISRVSSSIGDSDPTLFFNMVRDNSTCKECIRLHTVDGVTPRLWRFSELKHSYHKRGEDRASIFGLHPHCFTAEMKISTDKGLFSFEELFKSQEAPNVLVDFRIKNKEKVEGETIVPVAGDAYLDSDSEDLGRFLPTTTVYDTGVQEVIRLILDSGQALEVSCGHEMWIETDINKWKKVQAKDLKGGEKVPLSAKTETFGSDHFPLEAELMGIMMGDARLSKSSSADDFFGQDTPYGRNLCSEIISKYPEIEANRKIKIYPRKNKRADTEVRRETNTRLSREVLANLFSERFGFNKDSKIVPSRLFTSDKETVSAFLRGVYAADGYSKFNSAFLSQIDLPFLRELQLLLSMFGLQSRISLSSIIPEKVLSYVDRVVVIPKVYVWRLCISHISSYERFINEIGFGLPSKQLKAIKNRRPYLKSSEMWITAKIERIEHLGQKQTYCLTEPMTNTVSVNGVVTGQCRCSITYLSKGFGFNSEGKVTYVSENFDAYKTQKKK